MGRIVFFSFLLNDGALSRTTPEVEIEDEDQNVDLSKPIENINITENSKTGKEEGDVDADAAISSAQDLLDKLNTLQNLLGQMNHISPEMAEQVTNLRKELKNLGLGDTLGDSSISDGNALEAFVKKCWSMAVKYLKTRISTRSNIVEISNANFTAGLPEEMVDNTVFETTAYCCQEITEEEIEEFDSKKGTLMPQRLSLNLGTEESKKVVRGVSTDVMKLIYEIATESSYDIKEAMEREKSNRFEAMEREKSNRFNGLSTTVMAICSACFIFLISVLLKRFLDMQRDSKCEKKTSDKKKKKH